MRVKQDYLLREVADTYVVVPTGNAALDFSGMITLNETGAFLWKQLVTDRTEEELIQMLLEEYYIDEATATLDLKEYISKLKAADLFE